MTQGRGVLYVARILPHYRYDVFLRLERTLPDGIVFAGGPATGGIPVISSEQLREVVTLNNRAWGRFVWQTGVAPLLLRQRPKVVVFEGDFSILSTWLYAAVARVLGCRVVFWTIGWHRPDPPHIKWLRVGFYYLANHLMLYGQVGRGLGLAAGFPEERMSVIGNSSSSSLSERSVEPSELSAWTRNLPDVVGPPILAAVIRLNPVKGLDLLVRAAAVLSGRGVPVRVLLVGDGPDRDRLQQLARDLNVEIYLPGGAYSYLQLQMVYDRASVCVVPKTAGLTVVQSLKFGVPVITDDDFLSQAPEAEAITPGSTGDYYRKGDVQHLADVITRWLARTSEDNERVARDCRHSLTLGWNPESHAQNIVNCIRRVSEDGCTPEGSRT